MSKQEATMGALRRRRRSAGVFKLALTVAIAATLSGCFVSKVDPQKPVLPLPDALPAQAEQTSALPNPWWTLFGDEKLNELIVEALKYNPDAQVAAARV